MSSTGSRAAVPTRQQPGSGSQILHVIRAAKLHKRPRLLTTLFLWIFGLYAMFLSPAPVTITDDKMQRFEDKLQILAKTDKPRQAAEQRWLQAEMEVRNAKEWFWRFKAPARERVSKKQKAAAALRQEFDALDRKAQQQYYEAKSQLGLWSDAGVEEGRQLFWKAFESGKVFGRRQTFWDGLITLLTSREEGLVGLLIQFIIQAMINFTTGMLASVVIFIFQLPAVLWSYQPSLVSGLAFFLIAVIGALSVLASFLLALYGAGATAIYSMATLSSGTRLQYGRRRPRSNLRYHMD